MNFVHIVYCEKTALTAFFTDTVRTCCSEYPTLLNVMFSRSATSHLIGVNASKYKRARLGFSGLLMYCTIGESVEYRSSGMDMNGVPQYPSRSQALSTLFL